jgi:hypothetical protein
MDRATLAQKIGQAAHGRKAIPAASIKPAPVNPVWPKLTSPDSRLQPLRPDRPACRDAGRCRLAPAHAGEEDDDHNPDRVKPRHVLNLGVGTDNLFHTEKHEKFTASREIANLTNRVARFGLQF